MQVPLGEEQRRGELAVDVRKSVQADAHFQGHEAAAMVCATMFPSRPGFAKCGGMP